MFSFNLAEHTTSTDVPFMEHIRKFQAWAMSWIADDEKEIWTSSTIPIGYGSQTDIAKGRRLLPLGCHGFEDPRLEFEEDRTCNVKG